MTRGRKPMPAPDAPELLDAATEADTARQLAAVRDEARAEALAVSQHEAAVRLMAERIGYQLPAGYVDADLIQRDIAASMRRSVEACLEVGRGLVVLKEACAHGEFMARLEVLNLDHTVAKRFMQAARKFSNGASTHLLKAAGNQTKLFELLVLDDDEVEALALTGQTGELTLDDIACMTVKELRTALREARATNVANQELLAEKNVLLDAERARNLGLKPTPAEVLARQAEIKEVVNECFLDALGALRGKFRQALLALGSFGEHEERPLVWMAGLLGELDRELRMLRDELGLPDIDVDEHGWIAAMEAGSPFAGAGE